MEGILLLDGMTILSCNVYHTLLLAGFWDVVDMTSQAIYGAGWRGGDDL
jgi:hypothetical protein